MNNLARLRLLCAFAASTLLPQVANASEDALATDRPDFAASSNVVGAGCFQIETSIAHERDARDGVVDLRLRLGSEIAEYTDLPVAIVLNVRKRLIGVVVDSVSDVLELGADSIKPTPEMGLIDTALQCSWPHNSSARQMPDLATATATL